MSAEYNDGRIVINDYECDPRNDAPGVIADFFLKFQQLDWPEKEHILRRVGYGDSIGHGRADITAMTADEYSEHLDRSLLISIIDNEASWWAGYRLTRSSGEN